MCVHLVAHSCGCCPEDASPDGLDLAASGAGIHKFNKTIAKKEILTITPGFSAKGADRDARIPGFPLKEVYIHIL